MSHIGWGGEQVPCFKALRGSPKEKSQREQYLLAVDLLRGNPKRTIYARSGLSSLLSYYHILLRIDVGDSKRFFLSF